MTHKPTQLYAVPRDFAGPRYADSLDGLGRHIVIGAMPSARAADASHSSLLRVSTIGGIAIAALCIIYFAAEFLR
jgi:hypothetical protein